jgi:hypothetical protein
VLIAAEAETCSGNANSKYTSCADCINLSLIRCLKGTAVAQCLRYCATNRKVAGSIPGGLIGIFH